MRGKLFTSFTSLGTHLFPKLCFVTGSVRNCRLPVARGSGTFPAMSTLTVELPDELASRLEAASRSRSVPPDEVVRELVSTLPPVTSSERTAYEVLGATFGSSASGLGDLSTNPKHFEGFGE